MAAEINHKAFKQYRTEPKPLTMEDAIKRLEEIEEELVAGLDDLARIAEELKEIG